MSSLGDAALEHVARGWFVFPLLPRSKTPATRNGFKDASTDVELVRAWWEQSPHANIGIDCGRSRLLVVDLDGDEGERSWMTLLVRLGRYVGTLTADTASGRHLYFAGEGPTTTRRLGRGIDTRGGGGYVVATGSVHPSGHEYRWVDARAPLLAAPEWLLTTLQPPPRTAALGERRSLPTGMRATSYGRIALEGLAADVLAATEGERNATLHRCSRRAGRLEAAGELDLELAELVLLQASERVGLGPRESELTFRSGFEFGRRYPTARAGR